MLVAIYTAFTSFQIVATLISAVLCYRIAHLKITPTFTWILLFFAFIIKFTIQINGVFYIHDIIKFVSNYSITLVVMGNVMEAMFTGLFLVAIFKIFNALKSTGLINTLKK